MSTKVRRLSREEARRIAIRAQLLEARRPKGLVALVEHLTLLQLDPTAVVAPSADLVAWSRLGNDYQPRHLQQALEQDRTLFEHRVQETAFEPVVAMVRPMKHLGLFLAEMSALDRRYPGRRTWLEANDGFRRRLLDQLRDSGPLQSRDIPDTSEVSWTSTGWTNDRNVTQMLEFLAFNGEVAVAGRRGKQRLWDLAERVYPSGVEVLSADLARKRRDVNRLRALGVARPQFVGAAGESAEVEGVRGEWRVDPKISAQEFEGRTALLSPFDRLIYDRARTSELFDFEYILEMYKPKEKRRWGYFALPVLHDDRLVGKVDVAADRKASMLHVHAIHHDVRFTATMTRAVRSELERLAQWLRLDDVHVA